MSVEKTSKANADIAAMTYEQARDELVKVVADLEQGAVTLEESMALWERGETLATQCESWLSGARKRLDDAIKAKADANE
jgi:exodeoxyribonuclease VII small subunit